LNAIIKNDYFSKCPLFGDMLSLHCTLDIWTAIGQKENPSMDIDEFPIKCKELKYIINCINVNIHLSESRFTRI
jgi:hypothetical protein